MPELLRIPVAETLRRLATGHPCHNLSEGERLDIAETVAALEAWGHLPPAPDHRAPRLALFGPNGTPGRGTV